MKDFNDLDAIKKIDPQDTLSSTNLLVDQLQGSWDEVSKLQIQRIDGVKNIVFCGMGASIYGALVTKALFANELQYPVEFVLDYHLPAYTNRDTLVVLASYSGTTEEVLSCADEALAKSAKMLILTKGGQLAEFAKKHNVPAYIFDGKLNPAGVPRLGIGYGILGLIGLLNKLGVISVEEEEIQEAITRLKEKAPELITKAKNDYEIFVQKIPVIFAAEHLSGNAQILRNQFNETSKAFSAYYLVPDLNHHLMEGLQFPTQTNIHFFFLNSPNYSPKIKQRMDLTREVVLKNNHKIYEFTTTGQTLYDDFMEVVFFGSQLTLYLSLFYNQNPAINPWVDYFKDKLKSS